MPVWKEFSQRSIFSAGSAGFFPQFPSAAVCRVFARFQLAGGDFQCDLLHGIAELLYHEDSALFRQGYYADTAGVVYHITLYLLAVLQFRCVPRHVENFALIGLFRFRLFFPVSACCIPPLFV